MTEQPDPMEVNGRMKELIRQRDDYANRLVSVMGTLTLVVYERDNARAELAKVQALQPAP